MIKNWYTPTNRVEEISFSDGSSLSINDMLISLDTDGNDFINGTELDDTIDGAQGNDTLQGKKGDDTYIFNFGDGQDTIIDSLGANKISLGEGITANDVIFSLDGDKLYVELSDGSSIAYNSWYDSLSEVTFADGSSISRDEVLGLISTDSDDVIVTGSGDDIIIGNGGNDTLEGGAGNDIYVFNLGDGHDIINDDYTVNNYKYNAGNDTLKFGDGITVDDLVFEGNGTTLKVGIREDGKEFSELSDTITITNAFDFSSSIDNFSFSNGDILSFKE